MTEIEPEVEIKTVTDTPNPEMLRGALDAKDERRLLKYWPEQQFFFIASRQPNGIEKPISVKFNGLTVLPFSRNRNEVEELIATLDATAAFTPPYPRKGTLQELARVAFYEDCGMIWVGEKILLEGLAPAVFATTSLLIGPDGSEQYYEVTPVPLEGNIPGALQPGSVQQWSITCHPEPTTPDQESKFIYDDRIDWLGNPALPMLFCDAVPRSALPKDQSAIFDRWLGPILGTEPEMPLNLDTTDAGAVETESPVPSAYLGSHQAMHTLVKRYLFPDLNNLKLEISMLNAAPGSDNEDPKDSGGSLQLRILLVPAQGAMLLTEPVKLYEETLTQEQLEAMPWKLPRSPGTHPFPEALRKYFIRYISWDLLQASRQLGSLYLLQSSVRNLISAWPDNSISPCFTQPDDERFPFLARFLCGNAGVPKDVPVIVVARLNDNYVCNPLIDIEIPAVDVPANMPDRDKLVRGGCMNIWRLSCSLLVPTEHIDFPEAWYTGVRVAATRMVRTTHFSLELLAYNPEKPRQRNVNNSSDPGFDKMIKWIGFGIIVFVFTKMITST
jgi:hypothetical protein